MVKMSLAEDGCSASLFVAYSHRVGDDCAGLLCRTTLSLSDAKYSLGSGALT